MNTTKIRHPRVSATDEVAKCEECEGPISHPDKLCYDCSMGRGAAIQARREVPESGYEGLIGG